MANRLIHSSSPYLLQHAQNPVDWYEWGEEALQKATKENKLIIVSIGYSACHWCHVMEHQCFENEELAALMNEYYLCIKVDREERPDIDQIYMDAVHAMGLQGGWPLNVFLMPDTKPFYGGTYFPPQQWEHLLKNIQNALSKDRESLERSAEGFAKSLNRSEIEKYGLANQKVDFDKRIFDGMFQKLQSNFDEQKGGNARAPKFPMPCTYNFLLNYYLLSGNENALKHTLLTLDNMAMGGIYDQIRGGFARYSTDMDWLVPHFEKMLYDNAQLVSLYCLGYRISKKDLFKETVYETIDFLKAELSDDLGGFYSALDADSEGEEGKFYTWTYEEFVEVLGQHGGTFAEFYNIFRNGNWEHGQNIPHRTAIDKDFAKSIGAEISTFKRIKQESNQTLLKHRNQRIRPGLDNKILCSWNGLTLKGLTDAYQTFGEPEFLELAIKNADFIWEKFYFEGHLLHTFKDGKASLTAYLEDYAAVCQGYIHLYQCTFDEQYIEKAKILAEYVLANFYDPNEGLFYFTDQNSEKLIARKKEIMDNVIPSSNSIFIESLYVLGHLFENMTWVDLAEKAIQAVSKLTAAEPYYMAQWGSLSILNLIGLTEIAILGPESHKFKVELNSFLLPNMVVCGLTNGESMIPLLKRPFPESGKTAIYICRDFTCLAPVYSVEEAVKLITAF